uniref:DinB family protein n=1 Tax=Roseihalotalea indica TaxID=2867963 RepID=A0AA49JII5_9BACT|nr:DinB family protein [Tunicatimonas sp. TK19036]
MQANKWTSQLLRITSRFQQTFGTLTAEQLNWKPDPSIWSIAQNIDHLMVINKTYFPILTALQEGTYRPPFMARIGFMVNFLGNTLLKAVQPDRKKKTKTFPLWEPTQSEVSADILKRFEEHQVELARMIEHTTEAVEKGTVIASPANRNIVYKLETAFDIIVAHEHRHFEQAKEVLERLPGQDSAPDNIA